MIAGAAIGLVIGVLVGLLGGGGSILAVPALVYLAGLPLAEAVPASLLVVGVTAVVGVLPRLPARQVQWRIAIVFGGAGALTAVAGAAVNRLLPEDLVLALFAALMVAAGLRMLQRSPVTGTACSTAGGRIDWRHCLPRAIGGGLGVGFLTGLLGVGGGFLVVPALVIGLGVEMGVAIGTSLVIVAVNSAAGFAAYAGRADLDADLLVAVTLAAATAAVLAARLSTRLPTDRLRRWFGVLVLVVAAAVLAEVGHGLLTA
ncbi:sulfite exporter TauE/SafE family protein [Blastococcus litoris]|uniref:sulfite exporter TauE/SafE family protein n=1 Tax=Blastococcus litoris TaxID=2171622 RepID=UPI000E301CE6|nr:sulfite exporter TauE/SafE family protein [Blastococcus litoris]